jgi:hypothetical protein
VALTVEGGEDVVAAMIWRDSERTDDLQCWGVVN